MTLKITLALVTFLVIQISSCVAFDDDLLFLFPCRERVRNRIDSDQELIIDELHYNNWTSWGECMPESNCIQERSRECKRDSYRKYRSKNGCLVQTIIERRKCESPEGILACQKYTMEKEEARKSLFKGCGINSNNIQKIAGGTKVKDGKWPWALSLSTVDEDYQVRCGAILISPFHVLTAAHCIDQLSDTLDSWIKLDENILEIITPDGKKLKTDSVIFHKNFVSKKKSLIEYDLAILRLESAYNATPICIDSLDINEDLECFIVGSGQVPKGKKPRDQRRNNIPWRFDHNDHSFFDIFFGSLVHSKDSKARKNREMLEAEVQIHPLKDCERFFGRLNPDHHICAGGHGKDTCSGDSGGGLYCRNTKAESLTWSLVGVTSFGMDLCVKTKQPLRTIYSSISGSKDWIESKLFESIPSPVKPS